MMMSHPNMKQAKPIIYRFLRVEFGIASSPFLLNGSVRHHLKNYVVSDQKFITKFKMCMSVTPPLDVLQ